MGQLITTVRRNLPPVGGVANGAMVLSDTSLLEMSFDQMIKVLKPKVDGSRFLDEIFYNEPLDFFIFFSSISCVFGNSGQSNYSAANMYMVSLASQRRKRGLAASAIDIGAVLGVGYISREAKQHVLDQLSNAGYRFLSERDFHLAFAEAILLGHPDAGGDAELITGLRVTKSTDEFKPKWCSNPRFHHTIQQSSDSDFDIEKTGTTISIRNLLQTVTCSEQVMDVIKGLKKLNLV